MLPALSQAQQLKLPISGSDRTEASEEEKQQAVRQSGTGLSVEREKAGEELWKEDDSLADTRGRL